MQLDSRGRWEAVDRAVVAQEIQAAEMSAGILSTIERPLNSVLPGVPVGSIVVGGGAGLIVGEVIDGVINPRTSDGGINFANIAVKGAAAFAFAQFGSQALSRQGATAAVIVLGVQIIADVLPLDRAVNWIVDKLGGLAVFNGSQTTPQRQLTDGGHQVADHSQTELVGRESNDVLAVIGI